MVGTGREFSQYLRVKQHSVVKGTGTLWEPTAIHMKPNGTNCGFKNAMEVCMFPWAVITKYYKLGGSEQRPCRIVLRPGVKWTGGGGEGGACAPT